MGRYEIFVASYCYRELKVGLVVYGERFVEGIVYVGVAKQGTVFIK